MDQKKTMQWSARVYDNRELAYMQASAGKFPPWTHELHFSAYNVVCGNNYKKK